MYILIADDQPKVRSALRLLLEQEPDPSVIGESADAQDLLAQVTATCPDLVLLDWELPGIQSRSNLIVTLCALCPRLRVVVLSGRPEARQAALAAGADAFVSKGDSPETLLTTLRRFYDGHDNS
jgi:DNA-binding NarL/FixJ family response regulator